MKKNILILGLIISSIFVVTACSPTANKPATSTDKQSSSIEATASSNLEMTLEELAKYNGKDGQPAYIAVDGIIYDVSNSPKWKNGEHNGFSAGNDLTEQINNISPHGVKVLERLNKVGTLKTAP